MTALKKELSSSKSEMSTYKQRTEARLTRMHGELNSSRQNVQKLQDAKKLLEEDLLAAQDKMKSYLVEERSHKMDALRQKLESSRQDVQKLEKENMILEKQIEDCRVQVKTLNSDKSALKSVVKQTKLENKELFEQIGVYESVLKAQERELMGSDNGRRRGKKKKKGKKKNSSSEMRGVVRVSRRGSSRRNTGVIDDAETY